MNAEQVAPEMQVAIINAVDHFMIANRATAEDYTLKETIRRILEEARPSDSTDNRRIPSPAFSGCLMFLQSIKESGYQLTKIEEA